MPREQPAPDAVRVRALRVMKIMRDCPGQDECECVERIMAEFRTIRREATLAERERCAKIAESLFTHMMTYAPNNKYARQQAAAAKGIAATLRREAEYD